MKRLLILVGILALLVLSGVVVLLCLFGEPVQDGKPISYWISQMGMNDGSGKMVGETALDKIGSKKSVPYLIGIIGRKKHVDSRWERFYDQHYNQFPSFIRHHLTDPHTGIALDMQDFIRGRAGYYMIALGRKKDPFAKAAIPQLVSLMNNPDATIRFWAANSLTGFGPDAAPAIPVIIKWLETKPENFNDPMVEILENAGPPAKEALPSLTRNLGDKSAFIRIECARALWKLDTNQANLIRPVVLETSTNQEAGTRIESAALLWRMDKDPAPVIPVLIGLLDDDSHAYDYRTITLLKSIGPVSSAAAPALTNWLTRNRAKKADFIVKRADEALAKMSGLPSTNLTK